MTWSLVLFLSVAAQAAPSADAALSACIVDRLSPDERNTIITSFGVGGFGWPESSTRSLFEAAGSCAPAVDLAGEGARRSMLMAAMIVSRDHSASALSEAGLNLEMLDGWFDAQPLDFRTRLRVSNEDGLRIFEGLTAAGIPPSTSWANGRAIGRYYGARAWIERLRHGLPIE